MTTMILRGGTRVRRAEPGSVSPGTGVYLYMPDCADLTYGLVLDVYLDAIGQEVAKVKAYRDVMIQCVRFLYLPEEQGPVADGPRTDRAAVSR